MDGLVGYDVGLIFLYESEYTQSDPKAASSILALDTTFFLSCNVNMVLSREKNLFLRSKINFQANKVLAIDLRERLVIMFVQTSRASCIYNDGDICCDSISTMVDRLTRSRVQLSSTDRSNTTRTTRCISQSQTTSQGKLDQCRRTMQTCHLRHACMRPFRIGDGP